MAYAVFADDGHYHLLRRASEHRTLCGLKTLRRDAGPGEYLPPARVTAAPPGRPYEPCTRCLAEAGPPREGPND